MRVDDLRRALTPVRAEILAKYDRPVPRYTSYPTAPHFHAGIGPRIYRQWLDGQPSGTAASLYIHVPFCRTLCWYCGCHTWAISRARPVEGYSALLRAELRLVAAAAPQPLRLTHVHWGGGTPTTLGPNAIEILGDELRSCFEVAQDAEIAMEIDPRMLDDALANAMRAAGVNRASIGVQDFSPSVQKTVNRIQPFDMVAAAVDRLRRVGIERVNFDLMYGLPLQSPESLIENVDRAVMLRPPRLALFGYAHVPWMKPHQRLIEEHGLPDVPTRWAQFAAASTRLQEHGYVWVGLDHFARPDDPLTTAATNGSLRRNFQGYTTDTADLLIGIGPSAIGALPQGYVQNAPDFGTWCKAVARGEFATARGIALSRDDRLRRYVIERLMCDLAIDPVRAAKAFGLTDPALGEEMAQLETLVADGLLARDDDRFLLTADGRPLMRAVAAVFDRYLVTAEGRHTRAL